MGYVFLIILLLWILWLLGTFIVVKIRETIENNIIRRSGLKEELKTISDSINAQMDSQIKQTKSAISSLRETFFQQLPNLENRIARDRRRNDYKNHVLPYKYNYKRRRR